MKTSLNTNFIKSSNLIFISAGLGSINFLLSPDILVSKKATILCVMSISLVFAVGLLIRFGISWVKFLLLFLIILGFNSLPKFIKEEFANHPFNAVITVLQSVIQIYATLLLFLKPKLKVG
ncbi:hypothetical protein [Flavobacterium sp. 5]|uniref:hypothetical protein n=1 Tax=Flavobacterium sp. 5 TaxID=2035199 RepID=UPI000C2CBC2C|nr:hypothetical protein [Flavobacterium sp. 5]PKB16363.1 hypothetical protein CLU82_1496 [Flavobacterium sp. 5]